jgi:hypothetical protein
MMTRHSSSDTVEQVRKVRQDEWMFNEDHDIAVLSLTMPRLSSLSVVQEHPVPLVTEVDLDDGPPEQEHPWSAEVLVNALEAEVRGDDVPHWADVAVRFAGLAVVLVVEQ